MPPHSQAHLSFSLLFLYLPIALVWLILPNTLHTLEAPGNSKAPKALRAMLTLRRLRAAYECFKTTGLRATYGPPTDHFYGPLTGHLRTTLRPTLRATYGSLYGATYRSLQGISAPWRHLTLLIVH